MMSNFWLRLITATFLVLGVGFIFLYLPKICFTFLLLAILIEILLLEWPKIAKNNDWLWLFALVYLILPLALLVILNQEHEYRLLGVLLIVVPAFDMGAYLFGKSIGKHKLLPQVSPNKTWEGVLGGFLAVLAVLLFTSLCHVNNFNLKCANLNHLPLLHILILAIIITILGTLGDLFESWLKRRAGIKDSGCLLPGHGGFLDRIDGFIFVTFFFYFCKNFVLKLFL